MTKTTFNTFTAATTTASATQDITISGNGPIVGLFIVLGLGVSDGTAATNGMISAGFWDATNGRSKTFFSESAQVALTDTYSMNRNDRVLVVLDGTGAVTRYATVSAITDGFRLTWDGTPATAWKISGCFWGGDAAQAQIADVTGPAAIVNASTTVSSLAFPPDVLIFLGPGSFGTSAAAAGADFVLGFATRYPAIKNACVGWSDPDNQATAVPTLYVSEDKCAITGTDGAMFVSAFSGNGFTVRSYFQDSGSAAPNTTVLALRLPGLTGVWCGAITSPTSSGVTTHTEPGFKMKGAILGMTGVTALDTQATDDSASVIGVSMVGIESGSQVERFVIARELDAAATTSAASLTAAKTVRMLMGNGTTMYTGNWDTAWPSSGISINWTATNATARKLIMLAFGESTLSLPDPRRKARRFFSRRF